MNVLSLFDGMSGGRSALKRLGYMVDKYYACEIDKAAIKVSSTNYPDIEHLGDVTKVNGKDLPKIDLLLGGSPCQSFSRSGDGSGFDGKSKLFWEYVRLLKECKPKYFLLENVVMKKEWEDIITDALGVDPILIDSGLLTAQKRRRLYWTNVPFKGDLSDRGITLTDIMDDTNEGWFESEMISKVGDEYRCINATKLGYLVVENGDSVNLDFPKSKTRRGRVGKGKAHTLNTGCNQAIFMDGKLRKLSPTECEVLQGFPRGYSEMVADNQRRKMLGNGWTIDVIAELLKGLI